MEKSLMSVVKNNARKLVAMLLAVNLLVTLMPSSLFPFVSAEAENSAVVSENETTAESEYVSDRVPDTLPSFIETEHAGEKAPDVSGDTIKSGNDSLSLFTVEFIYGGLEYVLDGMESVYLSEILKTLGLSGTVTSAVSSNSSLFAVEPEKSGNDWVITSLNPFNTNETLTLTIDGAEYVINVTDDATFNIGASYTETKNNATDGSFPETREFFNVGETFWLNFQVEENVFVTDLVLYVNKLVNGSYTNKVAYNFRDNGHFSTYCCWAAFPIGPNAGKYDSSLLTGAGDYSFRYDVTFHYEGTSSNITLSSPTSYFKIVEKPSVSGPDDQYIEEGETAVFSVSAYGGYPTSYTYQWYYNYDKGNNVTKIDGATSATYSVTGTSENNGRYYVCVVDNGYVREKSDWGYLSVSASDRTITASSGNGGNISPSGSVSVKKGADKTFTAVPDTGYILKGFVVDGRDVSVTGNSYTFTNVTSDHTIKAEFAPITYTVKFNSNGGSGSMSDQSFTYGTAQRLSANGFARDGYNFLGWARSSSATSAQFADMESVSNLTTSSNGTVTLYAVWAAKTYSVNFVDYDGTILSTQSVSHGRNAQAPSDPVRTGYQFTGWDKDFSSVTGNLTVTAQYQANTYTVKFNSNGGSGSMSDQSFAYGTSQKLSANSFTRDGYNFLGWALSSSATSAQLADMESVSNLTTTDNGTLTLYAIWKIKTYSVVWYVDYEVYSNKTVEHGDTVPVVADPYKPASAVYTYTFSHWELSYGQPENGRVYENIAYTAVFDAVMNEPKITITTDMTVGSDFYMEYTSGSPIFVDWGDGEIIEGSKYGTVAGSQIKIYCAGAITSFRSTYSSITALDLSNCPELVILDCADNQLTELDLSACTKLESLYCSYNQLTELDVTVCPELVELDCLDNQLTELDLSACTKLETLDCAYNQLTELDVTVCPELVELDCSNNQLTELDLSACTKLESLDCSYNQLTELDVSACPELHTLSCGINELTELDVTVCPELTILNCNSNQLTELDVSKCPDLENLFCESNQLTELDVTVCPELTILDCDWNQLTELDVTKNPWLEILYCNGNSLTELDVSNCAELRDLYCRYNELTELDVTECTKLDYLACERNQITELDVSKCTEIYYLSCEGNQLTELDVSKCTRLSTLDCSSNFITRLDISGLEHIYRIDCCWNDLTFSRLSDIEISELGEDLEYHPQNDIGIAEIINPGESIDLSSEYIVNDTQTVYTWYEVYESYYDYENYAEITPVSSENGVFTFGEEYAGAKIRCEMTNEFFPELTLRTTVAEIFEPIPTETKISMTTTMPVGSRMEIEMVSSRNVYVDWGDGNIVKYVDDYGITAGSEIRIFSHGEIVSLICDRNDLTGLDVTGCPALEELDCSGNELTGLDVTGCPVLKNLNCYDNQLTELDVTACPELGYLHCGYNQLTELDVTECQQLYYLDCYYNQLTELDVTACPELEYLHCSYNYLTELDVTACPLLQTLYCRYNELIELDLSGCPELINLDCYYNQLTELDVTVCPQLWELYCSWNQLTELDVTKCPDLYELGCDYNQLTELDVTACPNLDYLDCGDNLLTELDLTQNLFLTKLYCDSNSLTGLDISNCAELRDLGCNYNQLTELDVTVCPKLDSLYCGYNQLTELDVSACPDLDSLNCGGNRLTELDVTHCPQLSDLRCGWNQLTELDVSACPEMYDLDCSNNKLTYLDISGLENIRYFDCKWNYLTFSRIAGFELDKLGEYPQYYPQNDMLIAEVIDPGDSIDLSSENIVNGAQTDYTWYEMYYDEYGNEEYREITPTSAENGVFTFGMEHAGAMIRCKMTNELFPELLLSTTVAEITEPVPTETKISMTTALPVGSEMDLGVISSRNVYVDWGDGNPVRYEGDYGIVAGPEIRIFSNGDITELRCGYNELTELDVTACPQLEYLHCGNNRLTELDVTSCPQLESLYCRGNQLSELDVTACPELEYLDCGNNRLTELDVSVCADLYSLNCSGNYLTELDVAVCPGLNELRCYENQLTELDVSSCPELEYLDCDNNRLTELDVTTCPQLYELRCGSNQLTELDVTACPELEYLNCGWNQITELDVTACPELVQLDCGWNQIAELDVTACPELEYLYCENNQLTGLDVTLCKSLMELECSWNQLTELDVTKCPLLYNLSCNNNQLTELDVSACSQLYELRCNNNLISGLDVTGCPWLEYLSCRGNRLTELDVSACTGLYYLFCDWNQLTELDVTSCTNLIELNCGYNLISDLDVSGIDSIYYFDCSWNDLTYSLMSDIELDKLGGYPQYSPQNDMLIAETIEPGESIDLSSEYVVNGVQTVYTWYEVVFNEHTEADYYEITPTASANGVFTFGEEFAGKTLRCQMTNQNFPELTLQTTFVTVAGEHEEGSCRVTFDANGGTVTPSYKTVACGDTYGELPVPDRTGYAFEGWFTDGDEELVTEETICMNRENHTLVARWTACNYVITLDVNGGDALTSATMQAVFDSEVGEMPVPVRTGHTFEGWFDENGTEYTANTVYTVDGNITLTAQWTVNRYTITFDTNGGEAIDPITQDYGTAVAVPADPVRTGYTFTGWDTEIPATMPAEDMTITAGWQVNSYTITFNTDDGTAVDPITQDYGTEIVPPAEPEKKGYSFAGWNPALPETMPAEDLELTAQWTVNQYTITFDANGGEAIDPITQDYGTAVVAPADPVRTGYTFTGWDTEIPATMPAEDMTITAGWQANTYTITLDVNGGDALTSSTVEAVYDSEIGELSVPTRAGHTFVGWFDENGTEYTAGTIYTVDGDITLTADWSINSYTVTWKNHDGTVLGTDEVLFGETPQYTGDTPSRAKDADYIYTFAGWQPEVAVVDGDAEYTAVFTTEINEYGLTPKITSAASKLYEPWGIKYFASYEGNGVGHIVDRGIVMLKDVSYTDGMTAEEFRAHEKAHEFTTGDGSLLFSENTAKYPNGVYSALLDKGIYSYDIGAYYYALPFAELDNGEIIYGKTQKTTMEKILTSNLNSSKVSDEEKAICTAILALKESVAEHYAASGITGVDVATNAARGSTQTAAEKILSPEEAGVTPKVASAASRMIEPWGIKFLCKVAEDDRVVDQGLVMLSEEYYADSYDTDQESMRLHPESYVFTLNEGTLKYSSNMSLLSGLLNEGISSRDIDRTYYAAPYVVLDDGSYVYGTVRNSSMLKIMNYNYNSKDVSQTEKNVIHDIIELFNAVTVYYEVKNSAVQ